MLRSNGSDMQGSPLERLQVEAYYLEGVHMGERMGKHFAPELSQRLSVGPKLEVSALYSEKSPRLTPLSQAMHNIIKQREGMDMAMGELRKKNSICSLTMHTFFQTDRQAWKGISVLGCCPFLH